MQHKSTPPPRQAPGGGIMNRADSPQNYQTLAGISSLQASNDNRTGAIPTPLLRAAISWLYVAGFISEAVHDAAWKRLEGFA
jgi:hypothetical protein